MLKHITQITEQSLLLDFGNIIDVNINIYVNNFAKLIIDDEENIDKLQILNCVPSYNKILIQYNPLLKNKKKIIKYINSIPINSKKLPLKSKIIRIPICYDEEFALDMSNVSDLKKISSNEIISLHLNKTLHVFMIGFMPGLPFMGMIDSKLSLPRKLDPRLNVVKGSVGIVNNLCVIYPNNTPGGWNIIGRTPIDIFNMNKNKKNLIYPGDNIKFFQVSKKEFNKYNIKI